MIDRPEVNELVEPRWIPLDRYGSRFEQQMDVNSRVTSMRHRERRYTGEPIGEWRDGPAPVESQS